jgi:tricorn protease
MSTVSFLSVRSVHFRSVPGRPLQGLLLGALLLGLFPAWAGTQETRLLRQPTASAEQVAFAYGGDLWISSREGGDARRLTSTPAVESDPYLSPDGQSLAFSSNRSGVWAVYVMPARGGDATRLTWYPAASYARGWTPDGSRILYATSRETAPTGYDRLWTVSPSGGPSTLLPAPMGHRGSYAPDGRRMVVDRISRWDVEWRGYRGGQNTPMVILDLDDLGEISIPNDRTTDTHPVWMDDKVFFLSDRNSATNVWSYHVASETLEQVTHFADAEVKHLSGGGGILIFEQGGWIRTLDPAGGEARRLEITVRADFPWARPRWVDASNSVASASLSATGVRALMEARGEIFTVPVEHGSSRNLTRSDGAADRAPVWSPDGARVAWFSDDGRGYRLLIGDQDGLSEPRSLSIGDSKMAWTPAWSPDGDRIAFVDHLSRIRVMEVESGRIITADVDGTTVNRSGPSPVWSPDSKWLAYSKTFPNMFRRIVIWSVETGEVRPATDPLADAVSPAWDRDGRHLWFLASTDLALAAGWANTSSMTAQPTYGAYLAVLRADDPTPFTHRSDEEGKTPGGEAGEAGASGAQRGAGAEPAAPVGSPGESPDTAGKAVRIDFDGLERRIVALPMPVRRYTTMLAGPAGSVFIGEQEQNQPGLTLHKFTLSERKADAFTQGASRVAVSGDGKKILFRAGNQWRVVDTARPPDATSGRLTVDLRAHIDPAVEWAQIFQESWRYQRDFFYDPGTHGADWDAVRKRYEPLVEHVRHRADLNYILDMVNGELAVGHSFVGGGDMPSVESDNIGLLGADLEAAQGRWRITRIYTHESWNPGLDAPLDRPGMRVREGDYLLAVAGMEVRDEDDPHRFMEGTAGRQTTIHFGRTPSMEDAWTETVVPVRSEAMLRQRAWVEDNRRRVDELSEGRLAYVWVPNTGGPGMTSFDRYYFSQQDRLGAVIDERFNGGGLLDDYMVDLMDRRLRAAITNEAPGGEPFRLPAGILGPKVLLINEMAGSGGDYFPWVFRKQGVGPLIGTRTWGGLVRSCSHYPMVDGGSITSPCNAVFEPGVGWIAENEGVPPDVEVRMDARSVAQGRDPQLERGVAEALRLLEAEGTPTVTVPPFPRPARRPGG